MSKRDQAGAGYLRNSHSPALISSTWTSAWEPDEDYELVTLPLTLPDNLAPGDYSLWLGAYYWEDPTRLAVAADDGVTVDAAAALVQVEEISAGE